ncbi:MAG: gamma-glutamyl-gamma-aminobutyrate hydrolase family protein [Acidimicrobiia bacterium]|nr:gamma-glutamyl-gamma-aminobutyrate hydrolase family protein [Acidimicrobiia bacterium]
MTTPLIALTTYPPNDGDRFELATAYIHAVRRAGGRVVLVPPGEPDPAGLLAEVDGVVLTGGGDVDPAHYDHPGHASVDRVDADRDALELAIAELVLGGDLPTLAVCRGLQIVNVAAGGTLVADIPSAVPDALEHRRPPHGPVPHTVDVDAAALVSELMGTTQVEPMSWHHQAVDRPGDGFRVVSRASDGVVEVIEHRSHPWLAAIQWHPELTADTDPTQQRLFDGVVEAARHTKRGRRP